MCLLLPGRASSYIDSLYFEQGGLHNPASVFNGLWNVIPEITVISLDAKYIWLDQLSQVIMANSAFI